MASRDLKTYSVLQMKISNGEHIKRIINKAKFTTDKGEVVIFTNGNGWYIDTLIQNLLKSVDKKM